MFALGIFEGSSHHRRNRKNQRTMKSLTLFKNEHERTGLPEVGQPTKEFIVYALNQAPQGGFTMDEIEARLRIKGAVLDAVRAMGDADQHVLELEDADAAKLLSVVNGTRWGMLADSLPGFRAAVRDMKPVVKSAT